MVGFHHVRIKIKITPALYSCFDRATPPSQQPNTMAILDQTEATTRLDKWMTIITPHNTGKKSPRLGLS